MTRSTTETDCSTGLRRRLALSARQFAADSSGASAVEYGLLIAAIALAIVALVFEIGDSVSGMFEQAAGIYGN
jgi:pilus assembly protein Flp/PilA